MGQFLLANGALLPEMIIFIMSMVVLMGAVFVPQHWRNQSLLTLTLLTFACAIVAAILGAEGGTHLLFSDTLIFDHLSLVLKVVSYSMAGLLCCYAYHYLQEMKMPVGEFYVLTLLSVLGLSTLLSASHFITLFVGLELMSLPLYAMIAMRKQSSLCLEAAIKYFVIGAIATGILLYGIGLLYGATQSLHFVAVAQALPAAMATHHLLIVFSLVFIMVGVGFKLGIVPCHMWLPDVYEGAPTIMTMTVATLAKIGALGMLLRILMLVMPSLMLEWQPLLMALIVLSLFVGNITAVRQTNLKRLLAYSSIAQLGYILLGVYTGTQLGYDAAVFYLVVYGVTTLAVFALIMCFRKQDGEEAVMIEDYAGLFRDHPWHAVMFAIVMFSLAGVPPFVGFVAKLQVFKALLQFGSIELALYALLLTVVAAYYYIAVVKVMFFDQTESPLKRTSLGFARPLLSLNAAAVLVLGVLPGGLITWLNFG